VKLAGVYDRFAIEALMRDMPRRYDHLQPAEALVVEKVGVDISTSTGDAAWYSVNFTGFDYEQDALAWCAKLRAMQQRCVIYQPDENFEYVGLFSINTIETRAYRSGDSLQALRHAAEQEAESSNLPSSTKYGRLYSLLKIETEHAWLIDNRTYRLQRIPVGERLILGGKLKSVNPSRAVVSFQNRDYLLRPLYSVEGVEKSASGQMFARMRWGGPSGEIYYHRAGERIYGGGLIKKIDATQVRVDWKGTQISLPVMD